MRDGIGFDYEIAESVLTTLQLLKEDSEKDFFINNEIFAIATDIAALLNTLYDKYSIDYSPLLGRLVGTIGASLEYGAMERSKNDSDK